MGIHANRRQALSASTGRHALATVLIAAAAAIGSPAGAQSATGGPQDGSSAQGGPVTADADPAAGDIIVTARRREERLQDVPVAITAIGPNALNRAAVTDIVAISQLVPSLVVGRQVSGSAASIFLRGVGSSSGGSGFDQSVSTVLDGLPLTRGKEIVFSQFDLQQVEVLKGPQALFFGKNTTGGLINIRTADPTKTFQGSMKAGYEFEGREAYGEAMLSGPVSETLGVRLAVRGSTSQGGYVNSGGPAIDHFGFARAPLSDRRGANDVLSGRLTVRWEPSDRMDWTAKIGGTKYTDDGPSSLYERKCGGGRTTIDATTDAPADRFGDCNIDGVADHSTIPIQIASTTPLMRERTFTDSKSYYLALSGNYHFGQMTLSSITGWYRFQQADADDMNGSVADSFVGQFAKNRQFSQELRLSSDLDGPINVMVGGFYSTNSFLYDVTAVFPTYSPALPAADGKYYAFRRKSGFEGTSYSGFGELQWQVVPTLEFDVGARWSKDLRTSYAANIDGSTLYAASFPLRRLDDHFSDTNLSPQATLTWKPTSAFTLYGAYKKGYKSGGFNTSINITAAAQVADATFDSETAEGGELGARLRLLDGRLGINLTAYRYTYSGLQVQIYDPIAIATRIANAGKLRTTGIEGEFTFEVPHAAGLELHGSFAYNEAIFHDYVGTCFTGQTIAQGCDQRPNAAGTAFTSQDYEGRTAPKAPRLAWRLGTSYPVEVMDDWKLTVSTDMGYSSSYNYSDALRPDAIQPKFLRLDAGVRLAETSSGLEFALIGRNLTNKWVVTSANDMTGLVGVGGTGTATGKVSDIQAIVDRGRQVYLQVSKRF